MIKKPIVGQYYKWLAPETAKGRIFKLVSHYIKNEYSGLVYAIRYLNPPYYKMGDIKISLNGKTGVLEISESFIMENLNNLELVNVR